MPDPGVIDALALAALAVGVLRGVWRRLSGELACALGLLVGLLVGLFGFRPIGTWIDMHSPMGLEGGLVTAFVGTVLATWAAMTVARMLFRGAFRLILPPPVDRALGGLAGALRTLALLVIIFLAMNLAPSARLQRVFGDESLFGTLVLRSCAVLLADRGEPAPAGGGGTP